MKIKLLYDKSNACSSLGMYVYVTTQQTTFKQNPPIML